DGLHVLGQAPAHEQLPDMLCALTRLPNVGVPGLPAEVARFYGLDFATLMEDKGKRLDSSPAMLAEGAARPIVTRADATEAIESVCRALYRLLQEKAFSAASIADVLQSCLGASAGETVERISRVLQFACDELVPNLARTTEEISNLLRGLDGRYVPA